MSMLKTFLEIGRNSSLFDGLKVSKEKEICEAYMGKFSVISISHKDIDGDDYISAYSMICLAVGSEALRFQFLLESDKISESEKEMYRQLVTIDKRNERIFLMSETVLASSLKVLSMLLYKYYGKKSVI